MVRRSNVGSCLHDSVRVKGQQRRTFTSFFALFYLIRAQMSWNAAKPLKGGILSNGESRNVVFEVRLLRAHNDSTFTSWLALSHRYMRDLSHSFTLLFIFIFLLFAFTLVFFFTSKLERKSRLHHVNYVSINPYYHFIRHRSGLQYCSQPIMHNILYQAKIYTFVYICGVFYPSFLKRSA